MEAEISDLRQKIRSEQEEKSKLNEELNAAKVKHGKLTLKVKQLSKELQNRKSASPASSSSGLVDDSLDKAIQVSKESQSILTQPELRKKLVASLLHQWQLLATKSIENDCFLKKYINCDAIFVAKNCH